MNSVWLEPFLNMFPVSPEPLQVDAVQLVPQGMTYKPISESFLKLWWIMM